MAFFPAGREMTITGPTMMSFSMYTLDPVCMYDRVPKLCDTNIILDIPANSYVYI